MTKLRASSLLLALCTACESADDQVVIVMPPGTADVSQGGSGAETASSPPPGDAGPVDPEPLPPEPDPTAPPRAADPPWDGDVPEYVPDRIDVDASGLVYLLSAAAHTVYRQDARAYEQRQPLVLRSQGAAGLKPLSMAVVNSRLYLGYDDGSISWIDTQLPFAGEVEFARLAQPVVALSAVGHQLLAIDGDEASSTHHLFDAAGTERASSTWPYPFVASSPPSVEPGAYDGVQQRYYFFCAHEGTRALCAESVDTAAGTLGEPLSPLLQSSIAQPVRVSPDGALLWAGDGLVWEGASREIAYRFGGGGTDQRWTDDGRLVSVHRVTHCFKRTCEPDTTLLEERDARGVVIGTAEWSGTPYGLLPLPDGHFAVVKGGGRGLGYFPGPAIDIYPGGEFDVLDRDRDGVGNASDAFPDDPAVSLDRDHDGRPDAWNPGYEAGSHPYLDEFPDEAGCNYSGPDPCVIDPVLGGHQMTIDENGIVYALTQQVERWDSRANRYLAPIGGWYEAGTGGYIDKMAYSASQHRLYLGKGNGVLEVVDPSTVPPTQSELTWVAPPIFDLLAVGDFLLVSHNAANPELSLFAADGTRVSHKRGPEQYMQASAYDAPLGRVHYVNSSGLHYLDLDPTTGLLLGSGSAAVQPADSPAPYLRVSRDGARLLVNDEIYTADSLVRLGALNGAPSSVSDSAWLADGSIVSLRALGDSAWLVDGSLRPLSDSLLERRDPQGQIVERLEYLGKPVGVLPSGDGVLVVTSGDYDPNHVPGFYVYSLNDDRDGDGVPNAADAFQLDPAAALDSDRDGFPDAWNAGKSESDSTSGLVLDPAPNAAACPQLTAGLGGCDANGAVTYWVGQSKMDARGIVYLLVGMGERILRWDSNTGTYLEPLTVGSHRFGDLPEARSMEYAAASDRLYFNDRWGFVRFLDLGSDPVVEQQFTLVGSDRLVSMGDWLLVGNAVYDSAATPLTVSIPDSEGVQYRADQGRLYLRQDYLLAYKALDPQTGTVTGEGTATVQSDVELAMVTRVSADGTRVLIGSGDIYRASDLVWQERVGTGFWYAEWLPDGGFASIKLEVDGVTRLERWSAAGALVDSQILPGDPEGLFVLGTRFLAITEPQEQAPVFQFYDLE